MDACKRDIERQRNANEGDKELLERAYAAHLRAGGTSLEFAQEAKNKVETAKAALEAAIASAVQDITYVLCETAKKVIPEWFDEITVVEVDKRTKPSERDDIELLIKRVESGKSQGTIRKIKGVQFTGYPTFIHSDGIIANARNPMIWNERQNFKYEPIRFLDRALYVEIHYIGLRQQVNLILKRLPNLENYLDHKADLPKWKKGIPVKLERDEKANEVVTVLLPPALLYARLEGNRISLDKEYEIKRPPVDTYYASAVDALRFEAERRKRGEPASRLLEYLRERDLK